MKKLVSLLAIVALLCAAATPVMAAATEDEIAALTKDYTDISFYFQTPVANMSSKDSIEAFIADYLKDSLNCGIKFYPIDAGSYGEKMRTMCAAGEPFDMFYVESAITPTQGVQQGYFLPITELLQKYGQNVIASHEERVWPAVTFNGEIMLIPMEVPYANGSSIVYKADLFDKYKDQLGKDYTDMTTLADLEPYLELIKANEPDIIPIQSKVAAWNKDGWEITEGVYYYESNDTIGLIVDDAFDREINTLWNDYYKKGYVAVDQIVRQDNGMNEKLSGLYAVMSDTGEYTEDGSKSSGMYGFRCYESLYGYVMIKTQSLCRGMAISATTTHPERTMLFLNAMWGDVFLSNTMAFGLEDQDYKVISGDVHNPDETLFVEANSGADQHWAIWHTWTGPLWDQWNSNWNSTEALERMQWNNLNAPTSQIMGFMFDPEPVKVQIASVTAVNEEFQPILDSGSTEDIAKLYEDWRARLVSAGVEEVLAEVQKQLDAWKTANDWTPAA